MIFKRLSIITSSLLLSTSLFASFNSMNPLQSSSHDTTNQSNNKNVAISWNQATSSDGDTLAGYYYILDTNSNTLMPNVVSTRKTLGSIATSKTETITGADGSYYFHLAPYADGGNTGATLHFGPIKIDSTAPSALSLSPDGGSFSETQSVSMSATDANNYTIYYTTDGTTPTSSSTTYSSAITVASTKTIKAIAIDSAGNSSTIKSSSFTINTTTNVAQFGSEVTAGATIATNSDGNSALIKREVTVSGSSVTHYKYKVDSASFSAQTLKATAIDLSTLSDGSHTISIVGYDGSTWQTDASATTLSFTVDNTAPSAIAFSTTSGTEFTSATTITISSANSNKIYYTTDGSTPTTNSIEGTTVSLSSNGSYTIKAIAFDTAGNKTSVAQALYTVSIPTSSSSGGGGGTSSSSSTTEDEAVEETPTKEEVVEETPTKEEVVEETPTEEKVVEETPTEEEVVKETSTENLTSTIDTGLTKDETIETLNEDGSTTEVTTFANKDGQSIEVEVQTKLSTAITETQKDGTVVTNATAVTESGEELQLEVQINTNGTVQNTFSIGEESSDIDVAIVGADTIIKEDGSIQTTAEVTSDDGVKTTAVIEINANGSTTNAVELINTLGEKTTSEINVAIIGADTTVKFDGAVETVAETTTVDNVKTVATVEVKADGTTTNAVAVTNSTGQMVETKLDSNIAGVNSSIAQDGSVTIQTPDIELDDGSKVSVEVVANSSGTIKPSIESVDMPEFEAGSNVNVKLDNNKVFVEVKTILTKPITYN